MSYSYDINADIFLLSLSLKKETLIRHNYPPYDFLIRNINLAFKRQIKIILKRSPHLKLYEKRGIVLFIRKLEI